jgi:hypothetical protein
MKNLIALTVMALFSVPSFTKADVEDRLYDFTDAYYLANGINPALIGGRMEAGTGTAVIDTPIFSFQRNVRALLTLSAYGASGEINYFTVLGGFSADAFTANSAGQKARTIADKYIEYLFPMAGTDPIGFTFRQSGILDTRNGYFSGDPLGLWLHTWINFTAKSKTPAGKKALNAIAKKNGRSLDGTPIIATMSDIDSLYSKGYITKTTRPDTDPLRYAICPVFEDPRDGGIAPDQFLALPLKTDGTPLEPDFLDNFESLRDTGNWAN